MTYILYEQRDNPMFCPVMSLLALDFADNALKETGIEKLKDLFSLEIPRFNESLAIQWTPRYLEKPIYRRRVNDPICNYTARRDTASLRRR